MSGKIKICHVINAFENGGAEAVILNYISHMNRSRFEFHVISHGVVSQVCEKKFHDLGFIVHLIPSKKHPLKHVEKCIKYAKRSNLIFFILQQRNGHLSLVLLGWQLDVSIESIIPIWQNAPKVF